MTFDGFLSDCAKTAYVEPDMPASHQIIPQAVKRVCDRLKPGDSVLDIGCGTCLAMDLFKEAGMHPVGMSVLHDEVMHAMNKGHDAWHCDIHYLHMWEAGYFSLCGYDAIFARHVLEHSPCPLWVLRQMHDALEPGGWIYVEVPAPDTACHHERNPNHYSCLTASSWIENLKRAGFRIVEHGDIKLKLKPSNEDDFFYHFLCQKDSITSESLQTVTAGVSQIPTSSEN